MKRDSRTFTSLMIVLWLLIIAVISMGTISTLPKIWKIYGYNGTNWQKVRIDTSTRSLQTIDYAHHEIHSGSHYYIEGFTELDENGEFLVQMRTPSTTKWVHFLFEIQSNGILESYLIEDAAGGMAGGVVITPLNSNRNSSNKSGVSLWGGVVGNPTSGITISQIKVGGTGFKANIGGSQDRSHELILKSGTTYFRRFKSGSDVNFISFSASWYEHTDKTP